MSFVLTYLTHVLTHGAKNGIKSAGVKKLGIRTFRQEKQAISTGMQRFLYSRAVGKDEVTSSLQPRRGLVPCGNLASSSNVVAKSALRPRFFYAKIAIRPLPCFSSPTQPHFVGLCVGISVKRILSRIRLFCIYFASILFRNPAVIFHRPTRRPTGGLKGRNIA